MRLLRTNAIGLLAGVALASPAGAQGDPAPRKSDLLMQALLAPKVVTKAPASDFGVAAAACATAIGPDGLTIDKLDTAVWKPIPLGGEPDGKNFAFERPGSPVRIYLSTNFDPNGQCVVDGYGTSRGQFGAIGNEVRKQVGATTGTKLKSTGSSSSPNGFSQGQGFLGGNLMTMISSENLSEGMNIRVTLMRVDPAQSPYALASSAGMAAQFLPIMLDAQARSPAAATPPQADPKQ